MEGTNFPIQASNCRPAGIESPGDPTGKDKKEYITYLAGKFLFKTKPKCETILKEDRFVSGSLVTVNADRSYDFKVKFTDGEEVNFSVLPTVYDRRTKYNKEKIHGRL